MRIKTVGRHHKKYCRHCDAASGICVPLKYEISFWKQKRKWGYFLWYHYSKRNYVSNDVKLDFFTYFTKVMLTLSMGNGSVAARGSLTTSTSETENEWSYNSTVPYAFMSRRVTVLPSHCIWLWHTQTEHYYYYHHHHHHHHHHLLYAGYLYLYSWEKICP